VISSTLVLVTLLFLTPLFEQLPNVAHTEGGFRPRYRCGDNITLAIARLRNAARSVLDAADLIDRIGEQNIYLEIDDGVQAFLGRTPTV